MTIKDLDIESPAIPDRGLDLARWLNMPSAGGALMARDALQLPPVGVTEFITDELSPLNNDVIGERYVQSNKSINGERVESKETINHDVRADIATSNKIHSAEKNDMYFTTNVLNRLGENGDAKKSKAHKNPSADVISSNQAQTSPFIANKNRKETNSPCTSQERKKPECRQSKEKEESFIRENIAGNNAGHFMSEELLPIQLTVTPDGPIITSSAASPTCATCGEGIPNQPGGVCKQCIYRGKYADTKGGTFEEIINYAQNLASNVKKMFTTKGDPKSKPIVVKRTDVVDIPQSSEPSQKLQRYQSEIARQRCPAPHVVGSDDKHSIVCGDDMEAMSVDGEGLKDHRGRLEREASTLTNTDGRPPMARAKTKVKALFSSSRTKTFRSRVARTRTDHELKNDSVTSTLSCRADFKKNSILDSTRKSGRTQTFDSSNLHLRKDGVNRSRLAVMQEGTPVDPPANEDKFGDKSHRYALSRSATSPGTPGLKALQREKSNFGTGGPLVRTNTKLTLRANKAAVLRKENIHKATALFHQQPAIDTSDGSPQLERKRGNIRHHGDTRTKIKPLATISEKQSPANTHAKETLEFITTPVGSNIKQEAKVNFEPISQKLSEQTDSEIYCGTKNYMDDSKITNPYHEESFQVIKRQGDVEKEMAENNPYCDDLHHYGKGLEDQLLKQSLVENQSDLALTHYFCKEVSKSVKDNALRKEEEINLYTDKQAVEPTSQSKHEKRSCGQWYSLRGVTSKSSTQLREATKVRSSLSDVGTARSSLMGAAGPHTRKHVKYSETDVDSGTIYHMAKRIASNQKVSSHNEFTGGSNFFETGGDVSKSSSSTSDSSATGIDADYTGGFFKDAFDESEKKDVNKSESNASEHAYFEYASEPKAEPIECDIYTGNVFSPSANNLALSGMSDNWKNKSTNNSNRLPTFRYRSRTTMSRIGNRIILNCSNNSNSFVKRSRSPSVVNMGPKVTQTLSSSYVDYAGNLRPLNQPVNIPLSETIDFTKYDKIGMGDSDFFCSAPKHEKDKHSLYESGAHSSGISSYSGSASTYTTENDYTPGDRNSDYNNSNDDGTFLNSNNNYFGDFYTGEENHHWGTPEARTTNTTSASSNDHVPPPSPKYAPGSFYENAYSEPQRSPPKAQVPPSSTFFGRFTGYGEPPAQQDQYSPDYAGAFSHAPLGGSRPRSPTGSVYEGYGRTCSASPKRQSYENDGYFDYHTPGSREERRDFMESPEQSRTPSLPKIKRVGAIICRENVANKDDYAEDVNRDLMEDSWVPISYRLAAEQVKEMGGGRCSSRDLFKTTEAKCDSSLLDASPFAQGQMLEALGRKNGGWNLKQNTDSLKDDISMKWRDAREKGNSDHHQKPRKKKTSDHTINRTTVSSVWRPTDHIPAKARGNRVLVKPEPRGPTLLDKDGDNRNNSNPLDSTQSGGELHIETPPTFRSSKDQSKNSDESKRERKRAPFPSKVKIEYPKLKMRPPPPPTPPPAKPDVRATVVRGKDTLLISICKNPEKCVVQPDDIVAHSNPFEQNIEVEVDEDLDDEVEAERAKSQPRPRPLSCFKPTRWALLEAEPESDTQIDDTSQQHKTKPSLQNSQRKPNKPDFPEKTEEFVPKSDSVAREIGMISSDTLGDSSQEDKEMGKKPEENDGSLNESKEKVAERVNLTAGREDHADTEQSKTSKEKGDEKIHDLIKKYLSFSEKPLETDATSGLGDLEHLEEEDEDVNNQWPFLKYRIKKKDRHAYVKISQQLKDAQRLMDMPLRKREKRLVKSTVNAGADGILPLAVIENYDTL
ncbi:hypothetical protein EGW08_000658 [Elysia chlorotica]|uniref:Uncharacterized protein n=1 Tax=Elysia chlorotica TaxID=188477 RepID=A0A433UCT8_ELYCH|nr:hypothetical protein EGW08_000658 [Elysia chlorotica]